MANKKSKISEEELALIKEELKKEIMNEMKEKEAKKEAAKPNIKIPSKSKIDKFDKKLVKPDTKSNVEPIATNSNLILIGLLLIIFGGIYLLPKISEWTSKKADPEPIVPTKKEEKKDEKIVYDWSDKIIKDITLPVMRTYANSPDSYYKNNYMNITNFTNNDILYNAFINIYPGNIGYFEGAYTETFCGAENQRRELNAKYITARINNMFTKNTNYYHTDFYVPADTGSAYNGVWKYNAATNSYVYYGECDPIGYIGEYYIDILVNNKIETSEDSKTVYLNYNIGFAKLFDGNYEIYSDPNYTNLILAGSLTSNDAKTELKGIFENYLKDNKTNIYKYTYTTNDCSYSEMCYISGEWVNE